MYYVQPARGQMGTLVAYVVISLRSVPRDRASQTQLGTGDGQSYVHSSTIPIQLGIGDTLWVQ
jgi:hypothetical protein